MNNKEHSFYPWMGVFIFMTTGILICAFYKLSFAMIAMGFMSSCFLSFIFLQRKASYLFLMCLWICLGMWFGKMHFYHPPEDIYHQGKFYRKQTISIRGVFVTDVLQRRGMRSIKKVGTLKVKEILSPWGWKKTSGKVLVQIFQSMDLQYGDEVELQGKLHRPFQMPGETHFSYRQYLKNKDIHYLFSVNKRAKVEIIRRDQGYLILSKVYAMRQIWVDLLKTYLSEREAGIMAAMLLGDRTHIPKDIRSLFVRTGTAHILAISGLHIGILTGLLFVIFNMIPGSRRIRYGSLVIVLIGYALISGLRPSVVRAILMAIIFLCGFISERRSLGMNSLGLAGCLLLIAQPMLLFDIGFQLSFTCVFFILWKASALSAILRQRLPRWMAEGASVSVCAWVASCGWIVYYFGMVTPIGLIANIFVVPIVSIVLLFGLGFLLTSWWWPFGALAVAQCLKVSLNLLVAVIYLFDQCPGSYFYLNNVTSVEIFKYYVLVILIFSLSRKEKIDNNHLI